MRTPLRTTRGSRAGLLLTALAALVGLVVLGALAPATAQAESPRAAGDTSAGTTGGTSAGTAGGTFGGTTGGTTSAGTGGSTSEGTSGNTSDGTSSAGTSAGATAGSTAGTAGSTAGTSTIGGSTGDPGTPAYPTAPGAPTVVAVTPTSLTLTWTAPEDDVAITGYQVWADFGEGGATFATSTTNTVTVTGLHPNYIWDIHVLATDASSRWSVSPEVAVHTPAVPATTCTVGFHVVDTWGSGLQAEITVPNPGTTDLSDWDLAFVWAPGQSVTNMWGGTFTGTGPPPGFTQSGSTVTVTPAPYNSVIPAGGSVTVGFVATVSGLSYPPYLFTLDGTVCATVAD